MNTPRNPDTIIRELNDLSRLVENTHTTLEQFPEDRLLQLALRQDEQLRAIKCVSVGSCRIWNNPSLSY